MSFAKSDTIVQVDSVSKKFCRALHRSLRYGVVDMCREAVGLGPTPSLRKGEFWAVKDMSLEVKRGESVALMGQNGAGKSTLIKMIHGLIRPDSGRIRVRGRMGALTQLGAGFNPILSGRENVYINAAVLGFAKSEVDKRLDEILDFSGMAEAIDDPVRTYSSGMRSRLGYSIAAFLNPDLLLMDEVLATGDIAFRAKCFDHLEKLMAQGTSIIIVTHMMGQIARACNRFVIMDQGQKYFEGEVDEGLRRYHELMKVEAFDDDGDGSAIPSEVSTPAQVASKSVHLGAAILDSVVVTDEAGTATSRIEHKQMMKVRLRVTANADVDQLSLELHISNDGDELMAAYYPQVFNMRADETREFELSIRQLSLLRGSFTVRGVLLGGVPPHIISEKRTRFMVDSGPRPGLFSLPHTFNEVSVVEVD